MWAISNLFLIFLSFDLASTAPPLSRVPSLQLPFSNISSPSVSAPQHSTPERTTYHIPNTDIVMTIRFHEDRPLVPTSVKIVLSNMEVQLTNHIHQRGDGLLESSDDPYAFGIPGCWCSTGSAWTHKMTYKTLRSTIRALQVLMEQNKYSMASWDITEDDSFETTIGNGVLIDRAPDG